LIEKIKDRGDDVICHGRTTAETHTPFWEEDEARVVRECTDIIGQHLGRRPTGWMGPAALESKVTPDLLKEAGYTHLLDWPVDDQPIWFRTRSGPLLSVPYPVELNDFGTLLARDHTGREYADMIVDQFEEMLKQSERHPLVCSVVPYMHLQQPQRAQALVLSGTGYAPTKEFVARRTKAYTEQGIDYRWGYTFEDLSPAFRATPLAHFFADLFVQRNPYADLQSILYL